MIYHMEPIDVACGIAQQDIDLSEPERLELYRKILEKYRW